MRYIFCFILLLLYACSSNDNNILVTNSGEAQGSFYHIKYISENAVDYQLQIDSILQEIDSSLSIYKNYSLISKLNSGQNIKTDTFFNTVFFAAQRIFFETDRNFDCSIEPIVNAWGFYDNVSFDSFNIDSIKIKRLLNNVGFHKIELIGDSLILPKNMRLDFNSIAQGFTVDVIATFLQNKNIENYLIEVGGELLAKGKNINGKNWKVGVDKPIENIDVGDRFQFILELENKALATSGNYRKFYEKDGVKYSHTINPFTGFPAQNRLLSVTVIHDSCMIADAYATAFMVMGVKKTKKFVRKNLNTEIYLVYTDKEGNWKTYISPRLLDRIIN